MTGAAANGRGTNTVVPRFENLAIFRPIRARRSPIPPGWFSDAGAGTVGVRVRGSDLVTWRRDSRSGDLEPSAKAPPPVRTPRTIARRPGAAEAADGGLAY